MRRRRLEQRDLVVDNWMFLVGGVLMGCRRSGLIWDLSFFCFISFDSGNQFSVYILLSFKVSPTPSVINLGVERIPFPCVQWVMNGTAMVKYV